MNILQSFTSNSAHKFSIVFFAFSLILLNLGYAKNPPKKDPNTEKVIILQSKLNPYWVISENEEAHKPLVLKPNQKENCQKFVIEYGLGGAVFIRNAYSGKYLEVKNELARPGTPIVQGPKTGARGQQFSIDYFEKGYYQIKSIMNPDLVLEVAVNQVDNPLRLGRKSHKASQAFKLQQAK